ncbi:MAG: hypothetical protein PHH98_02280 [Candidatus Gracilibacteria bacterium]|nr:hypothetical protein [Candidatus Gracilibacteria bacterium]
MTKGEKLTLGDFNDKLDQISDGIRLNRVDDEGKKYLEDVSKLVSNIVGEEKSTIISNEDMERIREGLNFIDKPNSPKINEFMRHFNELIGNIVVIEEEEFDEETV